MSKSKYKIAKDVYATAVEEKDFGGARGRKALNLSKAGVSKDDYFNPESGEKYKFNILPFICESELNPYVRKGKVKVGGASYLLDLYVHRRIGPNKDDIVCPKINYGKPCPVCDERETILSQVDDASGDKAKELEKSAQALKAKRRAYLNVQLFENDVAQEPQILDASHPRFMKELLEEANECKDGDEPLQFACPEDGKLISCRCSHSDFSKYDILYKNIKFSDRKEEIEEEVLEKTISFDKYINVLTAEEIEKILWGQDEEVAAPTPAKAEKKAEAPAKAPVEEEAADPCPEGMVFGEDYDSDPDKCDTCSDKCVDVWKACLKASRSR